MELHHLDRQNFFYNVVEVGTLKFVLITNVAVQLPVLCCLGWYWCRNGVRFRFHNVLRDKCICTFFNG